MCVSVCEHVCACHMYMCARTHVLQGNSRERSQEMSAEYRRTVSNKLSSVPVALSHARIRWKHFLGLTLYRLQQRGAVWAELCPPKLWC